MREKNKRKRTRREKDIKISFFVVPDPSDQGNTRNTGRDNNIDLDIEISVLMYSMKKE